MANDNSLLARDWLLIADGEPLAAERLQPLLAQRKIMVLDGAYSYARQLNLPIDILLGDLDTISPTALAQARDSNISIIHTPDQDYTDSEKGIHHLDQLQATSITICCATGQRLQHTLHNLRLLKKYYSSTRPLRMITDKEEIQHIENSTIRIQGNMGDSIAVLGFPNATVTSRGLKYEMQQCELAFEKYASVSNALLAASAEVEVAGGALVIHEKV